MSKLNSIVKAGFCGILMCSVCVILTACGGAGAGKSTVVSNVKSVDQVLNEQINDAKSGDNSDKADTGDSADGTSDSVADNNAEAASESSDDTKKAMDAVNSQLADAKEQAASSGDGTVDVDLTTLSSTMVYSEVYNMVNTPDDYMGKKIRMKGTTSIYHDDTDNNDYYACVIKDATACCAQGIEFVLNDGNYPEANTEVTVVGTFSSYKIEDYEYYTLTDAVME